MTQTECAKFSQSTEGRKIVQQTACHALSVDVEDYFQVSAFADRIGPGAWAGFAPRVVRNTLRLLELFAKADVKATFFVLGWVGERNPTLVNDIHDAGHEIACHGYSHALIYEQTPEQFRRETRRAKLLLEDITGVEVQGYRAASFSIVQSSRWALDVLAEEGFVYDSSIFPVRHDRYGVPGAAVDPHRLETPGGLPLVEFPPTVVSIAGVRVPVAGGGYFRLYPYWLTRKMLRHVEGCGRRFMAYIHPWEIDPDQPRVDAAAISRFRHYVNLHRTQSRLDRLLGEFGFAPVRVVLKELSLFPPSKPKGKEAAA